MQIEVKFIQNVYAKCFFFERTAASEASYANSFLPVFLFLRCVQSMRWFGERL